MPKIPKEVTSRLIKYVSKVEIRFNPFDLRSKPAKELLRQMQSARFFKANPKLTINPLVVGTAQPPQIDFSFVDGSKIDFVVESPEQHCKEMMDQVFDHITDIDFQFEIDGKEIDSS